MATQDKWVGKTMWTCCKEKHKLNCSQRANRCRPIFTSTSLDTVFIILTEREPLSTLLINANCLLSLLSLAVVIVVFTNAKATLKKYEHIESTFSECFRRKSSGFKLHSKTIIINYRMLLRSLSNLRHAQHSSWIPAAINMPASCWVCLAQSKLNWPFERFLIARNRGRTAHTEVLSSWQFSMSKKLNVCSSA